MRCSSLLARTALRLAIALFAAIFGVYPVAAADGDVASLVKQLSATDAKARQKAADDLGHLGPASKAAVPALVKALSDKSTDLQWRAARALGAIGPAAKPAVPQLLKLCDHDDATVRGQAAHALGTIGDQSEEVVQKLGHLALDPEATVRRATFKAIRALKLPREVTIPLMVEVMRSAEPAAAVAALHTIAEAGEKAIPFLSDCCDDKDAAYWACLALAQMGPAAKEAVPNVMKVLEHEDPEVRLQALVTLGEIGPESKPAVEAITTALKSDDFTGVRYAAAFALGQIGVADEAVVSALDEVEASDDPFLKVVAAWALVRLAPDDKALVERSLSTIIAGIESEKVEVRRAAARALSQTEAPPDVVGPLLVKSLQDADPAVAGNAVDALASLGPAIVPRVVKALENKELRLYATHILAQIGTASEETAPALVAALAEADDLEFRRELQYALGSLGSHAADSVPDLAKSLASDDEQVRNSAVFALGRIGPAAKAAVPELRKLLESKDDFTRTSGFWALVRIQPDDKKLGAQAVSVFTKALSSESKIDRIEAADSLGLLGAAAKSSLGALEKAAKDPEPAVAAAAAAAVKKIQGK